MSIVFELGFDAPGDRDALEALQKVDVKVGSSELAVGDGSKTDALLFPDHILDVPVLDASQIGGGDRPLPVLPARGEQARGSEQASNVVCAEGRIVCGHRRS